MCMGENNTAYKPTSDMGAALGLHDELATKIRAEQAAQQAIPQEDSTPQPATQPTTEAPLPKPALAETVPAAPKPQTSEQAPVPDPTEAKPKPLTPEQEKQKARQEAKALSSTWMKKESKRIDEVKTKHPDKRLSQGEEAIITIRTFQDYANGKKILEKEKTIPINTDPHNADGGQPIRYTINPKTSRYEFSKTGGMVIQRIDRIDTRRTKAGEEIRIMVCTLTTGREVKIPAQTFVSLVQASETPAIIAHATSKSEQMGNVVAATIAPDTQVGAPPLTHGQVEAAARSIKMLSIDNVQALLANSGVNETVQQGIIALVGEEAFVDVHTTAEILYQLDFHNNPLRDMDHLISQVSKTAETSINPLEIEQAQRFIEQLKDKREKIEAHIASLGKTKEDIVKNLEGSLTKMNDADFTAFIGALVDDDKKAAFESMLKNIPEDQRAKYMHLLEGGAKFGGIAALAMLALIIMQSVRGQQ